MGKEKRFINGDIITWQDNEENWHLGLYWKRDVYSYLEDKTIIYFPEESTKDYITFLFEESLFPATDTSLIQKYIEDLISDGKISSPMGQINKRISEKTGEEIYNISGFILPQSIEKTGEPDWHDELIWCPSQCYCKFLDNEEGKIYCIYLRWRHHDPWTSELIPCLPKGSLTYEDNWEYIETKKGYNEQEYEKLKQECIKIIKDKFPNITWLKYSEDDF